jgi:hypothetical protein
MICCILLLRHEYGSKIIDIFQRISGASNHRAQWIFGNVYRQFGFLMQSAVQPF